MQRDYGFYLGSAFAIAAGIMIVIVLWISSSAPTMRWLMVVPFAFAIIGGILQFRALLKKHQESQKYLGN